MAPLAPGAAAILRRQPDDRRVGRPAPGAALREHAAGRLRYNLAPHPGSSFPEQERAMRSLRPVFLISLILASLGMAFSVVMLIWGPERIEVEGRSPAELLQSGDLVPLVVIPIVLLISALAIRPFFRILFPRRIKNAVSARARVTKVWDTGVSINDNPQVGLLLHVTPSMGAAFDAEAKTIVSRLSAAHVQPGITAEIQYDPLDPRHVQVVRLNLQETASGNAASRLEELRSLRDQRLITDEEYNLKRQEIIKSL
jgi:hypothetical protein